MARQQLWLAIAMVLATACTIGPGPSDDRATTPSATPQDSPGPSASPESGDVTVAWNSGTPAPTEPPSPSPTQAVAIPPCATDQLEPRAADLGGAGGSMAGGFLVRNAGVEPCVLVGRPAVALVDGTGRRLAVKDVATDEPPERVVLDAGVPLPAPGGEAAAGLAGVFLVWSNWCGRAPKPPLELLVAGRDGGILRVPLDPTGLPRCDGPQAPSTISVGPFAATTGPEPTDPPAIPAESLRLTLDVPDHAVAGQVLHYVAILANPTGSPIRLEPCPTFMERLNTRGGPVIVEHVLACGSVPVIAAGASVQFAMELVVPGDMPADPGAALAWALDPFHDQGFPPRFPEAKVPMPVIAP